jgi:3',5'-cyclic AMP phosphodiesterase CpdA
MKTPVDRRQFLKIAGMSLGVGALYRVAPALAGEPGAEVARRLAKKNGERLVPFSFVQMSDAHVGFSGPPNPTGTQAFERAVEVVNRLRPRPDLVLFTGDLTHDSEDQRERVARMRRFKQIARRLRVPTVKMVPGEHDAGIDAGALYHEEFGESSYSFDHRGVHFVGLDNVSRARPEVGAERIAWLRKDLSRFAPSTPVVVFTHRPLFDLKPEWEWFTSDGDAVMSALAPYENVTVLYGHIHREDSQTFGHAHHFAARSLIFAFPNPEQEGEKKPIPFDKEKPFANLGVRTLHVQPGKPPAPFSLGLEEVELTMREFSGTEGFNQLLKASPL